MSRASQIAADELAIADLSAPVKETVETTPTEATVEATPSTEQPTEEAKAVDTPPAQPKEPTEPSDTFEKRYKDLQREFTKRNQQQSQLEQEVGQYRQWYQQYQQWYQQQTQAQAQPAEDPDGIPTVQKTQELIAKTLQEERKLILAEADRKIAAAKIKEYEFQYAQEVGKYAEDLVNEEPLLKVEIIEDGDTHLYESMVKYAQNKLFGKDADPDAPRDIKAFKAHMKAFATKKAENLKKLQTNTEQAALVKAVKANKPGMTAPGGSTPAVQKPAKVAKFGSQEFRDQAAQWLIEEQKVVDARK